MSAVSRSARRRSRARRGKPEAAPFWCAWDAAPYGEMWAADRCLFRDNQDENAHCLTLSAPLG